MISWGKETIVLILNFEPVIMYNYIFSCLLLNSGNIVSTSRFICQSVEKIETQESTTCVEIKVVSEDVYVPKIQFSWILCPMCRDDNSVCKNTLKQLYFTLFSMVSEKESGFGHSFLRKLVCKGRVHRK